MKKYLHLLTALAALFVLGIGQQAFAQDAAQPQVMPQAQCPMCHTNIMQMAQGSKHEALACDTCHQNTQEHVTNPQVRPTVNVEPGQCGTCHVNQYKSMYQVNPHSIARNSKKNPGNIAPNPFFDEALGAHGFVKEHNLPRAHAYGAVDQFLADRAFGGRFEPKEGWLFYTDEGGDFKVWDKIKDTVPDNNEQKPHKPGTAAAANAVCWTCKSSDIMMDWAFMGDPKTNAKWSRASNPVELVKNINHANNCNMCHDPHSAKPRIIRDALIQAMTRDDFPTLYSESKNPTPIDVKDMGLRGFNRKIAILGKNDSKLQCAQCHVEYNCNPGINPTTGEAIKMDDPRTNLFPLVDVTKIDEFYAHAQFKDFKHNQTGALLTKMQHPDAEVYWNSKHDKMGVGCASCHMPKVKDEATGQTYTSHWSTTPRAYIQQTCLNCHKDKTEAQMNRVLDAQQAHYFGKIREAEGAMAQMFMAFREAKDAGITGEPIKQAQDLHSVAHTNWEWWTATNGAWFHNIEQAKTSLAKSVAASQQATKILRDAVAAKVAACNGCSAPTGGPTEAAAPAAPKAKARKTAAK